MSRTYLPNAGRAVRFNPAYRLRVSTVSQTSAYRAVFPRFCIRLKFLHVLASIAGTRIGLAF